MLHMRKIYFILQHTADSGDMACNVEIHTESESSHQDEREG